MKQFLIFGLLCTVPGFSLTYDFSAATAQLANNLNLYGNRVVVIVEQERRGEIFRYEAGAITQNTKLGIASCSKWLSGAVVLACAERGYFRLDDRVGDYLPVFNGYGKGHLTIRQCFAMTSGLVLTNAEYETDRTLTLAQSVNLIAAHAPILFTPGTQFAYEGDGMQVVGRICEVVTGKDWNTLARQLLFDPLGMDSADYSFFGINPAVAGGARCSASDYLKFLRMVMRNGQGANGRVVLASRSVQEFFTNRTFGLPEYSSPIRDSDFFPNGQRPDYGMGSWINAQNPLTGAVEEVASPGAFGTYPWVDRRRGLRGIIFLFGNGATVAENNLRVLAHLRTEIDAQGLPPPDPPSPLVTSVTDGYFRISWTGGGLLETSPDCGTWTPLTWASSPFLESLVRPPGPRWFYRLRR